MPFKSLGKLRSLPAAVKKMKNMRLTEPPANNNQQPRAPTAPATAPPAEASPSTRSASAVESARKDDAQRAAAATSAIDSALSRQAAATITKTAYDYPATSAAKISIKRPHSQVPRIKDKKGRNAPGKAQRPSASLHPKPSHVPYPPASVTAMQKVDIGARCVLTARQNGKEPTIDPDVAAKYDGYEYWVKAETFGLSAALFDVAELARGRPLNTRATWMAIYGRSFEIAMDTMRRKTDALYKDMRDTIIKLKIERSRLMVDLERCKATNQSLLDQILRKLNTSAENTATSPCSRKTRTAMKRKLE